MEKQTFQPRVFSQLVVDVMDAVPVQPQHFEVGKLFHASNVCNAVVAQVDLGTIFNELGVDDGKFGAGVGVDNVSVTQKVGWLVFLSGQLIYEQCQVFMTTFLMAS